MGTLGTAVSSILSKRLLHKMTNSNEVFIAQFTLVKRENVAKKLNTQPRYLQIGSINVLDTTLVVHKKYGACTRGEILSQHSHDHGDER